MSDNLAGLTDDEIASIGVDLSDDSEIEAVIEPIVEDKSVTVLICQSTQLF